MSEIVITGANKHGSKELASGDFIISFHVDRTKAKEILPLYLLGQDKPLTIKISDGEVPHISQEERDEQAMRKKLYASISIHAKDIGYSEEQMRKAFDNLTGKLSRKDMTLDELKDVESAFYQETQPPTDG